MIYTRKINENSLNQILEEVIGSDCQDFDTLKEINDLNVRWDVFNQLLIKLLIKLLHHNKVMA